MTNENVLLGLAAKAVGIKFDESRGYPCRVEVDICADNIIHSIENKFIPWDPRSHEGDRYRLLRGIKGIISFAGEKGVVEIPASSDNVDVIRYTFTIGNDEEEGLAVISAAADLWRQKNG